MGRVSKGLRGFSWLNILVGFSALIALSSRASANPIGPGPDFQTASSLLQSLFFTNLPIDAFLFCVALYFVLRGFGDRAGNFSTNPQAFSITVIAAFLVIAAIGAVIDFYAFYEGNERIGYSFWADRGVQFFGSAEFYLALVGVFVSIYASSVAIVRLNWKVSGIPATAMTILNPIVWVVYTDDSWPPKTILVMVTLALAIVAFVVLMLWHFNAYGKSQAPLEVKQ